MRAASFDSGSLIPVIVASVRTQLVAQTGRECLSGDVISFTSASLNDEHKAASKLNLNKERKHMAKVLKIPSAKIAQHLKQIGYQSKLVFVPEQKERKAS